MSSTNNPSGIQSTGIHLFIYSSEIGVRYARQLSQKSWQMGYHSMCFFHWKRLSSCHPTSPFDHFTFSYSSLYLHTYFATFDKTSQFSLPTFIPYNINTLIFNLKDLIFLNFRFKGIYFAVQLILDFQLIFIFWI